MTITSRTATLVESATGTSITGTLPTGLANGDVLVVNYGATSSSTGFVGPSGGYTALLAPTEFAAGNVGAAYYKVVTNAAGETGPVASWTSSGRCTAITQAYVGVDTTTPLDVVTTTNSTNSALTLALTSRTTVTNNARLISGCVINAASASTLTVPSEMTQVSMTTGTGRRTGFADEVRATAGATGTRTWTQSGAGLGFAAYLAALRPADGGGTTPALLHRMVGVPSGTDAAVAVRATNATSVRLKVGTNSGVTTGVIFGSAATPDARGAAQCTVTGLSAGTQYYYRVEMTDALSATSLDTGTVGSFKTAPTGATSFAFCFASCGNGTGSAAMQAIAARNDPLFLHLGDLFYDDGSGSSVQNFRDHINGRIEDVDYSPVFISTPVNYTPSDHDAGMNNGSTGTDNATALTSFNTAYRELIPTLNLAGGASGVYRTFTWGRVRFIALDTRTFKSAKASTDNSSKTALGTTQKAWLESTITAATEPLILILGDSPWVGAAEVGDDGWFGYTTERAELGAFFAASGKNIGWLAGDMHALGADDGSNAVGGIFSFQAAPLQNTTSIKGGPYSEGTYPTSGNTGGAASQYGRCVVTDTGGTISIAFTGYSSDNTSRITLTMTFVTLAVSVNGADVAQTWIRSNGSLVAVSRMVNL